MKYKILKVGFDLDGVILYNPLRIVRRFVVLLKKLFNESKADTFYIPKSKITMFAWNLLHKSSIFVSPAYEEIKKLVLKGNFEAYLISGRYSFLKKDFEYWVNKINAKKYFKGVYINKKDLQPYVFKEEMIKKLDLDIYIEDNWNIVKKLIKTNKKTRIFWLTNFFDKNIKYRYKFQNLNEALKSLI